LTVIYEKNKKSIDKKEIQAVIKIEKPNVVKEKLFLDIYSGMSYEEYHKTVKKLIEDNKIIERSFQDYYYNYKSNCNVKIEAVFENNYLSKIILKDAGCIYPVYSKKYNLPKLIEKPFVDKIWNENNPNYKPVYSYADTNGNKINLPDAFVDNSSFLDNKECLEPWEKKVYFLNHQ
jgi:hypothetical protein